MYLVSVVLLIAENWEEVKELIFAQLNLESIETVFWKGIVARMMHGLDSRHCEEGTFIFVV